MQKELLQLLAELECAANTSGESSALTRALIFTGAVLCELTGLSHAELKVALLRRLRKYMSHSSQQVRGEVANILT